jgi:hypothetical protein
LVNSSTLAADWSLPVHSHFNRSLWVQQLSQEVI